MAHNPDKVQPFRPLYSGRRQLQPKPVVDDRRQFYGALPGISQGNEVLLVPTGAWPDIRANIPQLQTVLEVTLKRPEPITLYFHPWDNTTDRFRQSIKYYAHASAPLVPVFESLQGRIFIEWGVGSARNWTYCDLAPGSLHIPSVNWVRVSGWIHTSTTCRLAASAQIGYSQGRSDCLWTAVFEHNAVGGYTVVAPNFARELTGYYYSPDVLSEATVAFQQAFALPAQQFLLRPAIAPNPQAIPYPPVNVPIGVGYAVVLNITVPGPTLPFSVVGASVTVRI
jgi:hypothetical protein